MEPLAAQPSIGGPDNSEAQHVAKISRYKGDLWFAYCPVAGCEWRHDPAEYRPIKAKVIEHALRMTRQVYS